MEVDDDGYLAGVGTLTTHAPQFGGTIWYVWAGVSTSGDGTVNTPFATIGEALTAAVAGDAISVRAGAYTENVDLDLAGLELWGEIGALLVGTLTMSGNSCYVRGMDIAPVGGAVGLLLSGDFSKIEDTNIVGTSAIAFSITGNYNILNHCLTANYTATGFDLTGTRIQLHRCVAHGADTATRGFYLSAATAGISYLENCTSLGNATAGYELATGVRSVTLYYCSSGSGDGRWVDADLASVWSGFTYDNILHNEITLAGAGSYNIFQITGLVQINYIYGIVTTLLAAATTNARLELFPLGGAPIDITLLAGTNISSAPVGSFIVKDRVNTVAISYYTSVVGIVGENPAWPLPTKSFALGQQPAVNTFIRLTVAGAGGVGVIHWHVDWEPLSDDGFLEVV